MSLKNFLMRSIEIVEIRKDRTEVAADIVPMKCRFRKLVRDHLHSQLFKNIDHVVR